MVVLNCSWTFYKIKLITYISEDLRVIIPRDRRVYHMISGNHLSLLKTRVWLEDFYFTLNFFKKWVYLCLFILSFFFCKNSSAWDHLSRLELILLIYFSLWKIDLERFKGVICVVIEIDIFTHSVVNIAWKLMITTISVLNFILQNNNVLFKLLS